MRNYYFRLYISLVILSFYMLVPQIGISNETINVSDYNLSNEIFVYTEISYGIVPVAYKEEIRFPGFSQSFSYDSQLTERLDEPVFGSYELEVDNCCDLIDKVKFVVFEYTGEDCSATVTGQGADKYSCTGDPGFDPEVYIVSNSTTTPGGGEVYFMGTVLLNDYYTIDATLAGQTQINNQTFIYIFDTEGGTLLQSIEFHASCSQPFGTNDQYGANDVLYVGGSAGVQCGTPICELDPGNIEEDEE